MERSQSPEPAWAKKFARNSPKAPEEVADQEPAEPNIPEPNGHKDDKPLDPAWMRKFKAQQAAKAAAAETVPAKEEIVAEAPEESDPSSPKHALDKPLDPAWMRKWKREQEDKAEVVPPEVSFAKEVEVSPDNRKKMQPGELPAWAKKYGGRSSRIEAAEESKREERIAEILSPEPAAAVNTSTLAPGGAGNRPKLSEMRKAEAERKGHRIATCRVGEKLEYIQESCPDQASPAAAASPVCEAAPTSDASSSATGARSGVGMFGRPTSPRSRERARASPVTAAAAAADEDEIEVSANGPMSGPASTTNTRMGYMNQRTTPKLSELRKREAARKKGIK